METLVAEKRDSGVINYSSGLASELAQGCHLQEMGGTLNCSRIKINFIGRAIVFELGQRKTVFIDFNPATENIIKLHRANVEHIIYEWARDNFYRIGTFEKGSKPIIWSGNKGMITLVPRWLH